MMEHKLFARFPIGNPRRVWKQDNFLLTVASAGPMSMQAPSTLTLQKVRRSVKTSMDAGFDVLGCLWAAPEVGAEIVRTAERYGGKVLFQDLQRFGGMGSKNIFCKTNDYEGAVRDTAKWKSVVGYCLWDEPILPEHMEQVRLMIDYCERVCPDRLPYTVANPDYNRHCAWQDNKYAPYIEDFLSVMEPAQMSFDYYPIGRSDYEPQKQLDNSTMWSDLEIVRRAAQRHETPFWFYYQGQHFPWHKIHYHFRFPMARAMAYAGVLHGAKALELYTEFDAYLDPETGGRGLYFDEQKKLNDELHALGNTLMALECLRVIHDDTLLPDHPTMEGLRTTMEESELLTGVLPKRISVSEHRDAYGHRYLMVLNRDYDNVEHIELKLKNPSHVYEVSKTDGEERFIYENTSAFLVTLQPGDLHLYRIQSTEEEPYTLEYYLEK